MLTIKVTEISGMYADNYKLNSDNSRTWFTERFEHQFLKDYEIQLPCIPLKGDCIIIEGIKFEVAMVPLFTAGKDYIMLFVSYLSPA